MPWTYRINTGWLLTPDGLKYALGYSGHGEGLNNIHMQDVRNVGPIPVGFYEIGKPEDTKDHGPCVLPLLPHAENEMHGRGGFLIHGDRMGGPLWQASHGCIILGRAARERIAKSGDTELQVVVYEPEQVVSDPEISM